MDSDALPGWDADAASQVTLERLPTVVGAGALELHMAPGGLVAAVTGVCAGSAGPWSPAAGAGARGRGRRAVGPCGGRPAASGRVGRRGGGLRAGRAGAVRLRVADGCRGGRCRGPLPYRVVHLGPVGGRAAGGAGVSRCFSRSQGAGRRVRGPGAAGRCGGGARRGRGDDRGPGVPRAGLLLDRGGRG